MTFSHYLPSSDSLFSSLKISELDDIVNSKILKRTSFSSNDNLPKGFFRKIHLLIHNTRSKEQLYTSKMDTLKYGT